MTDIYSGMRYTPSLLTDSRGHAMFLSYRQGLKHSNNYWSGVLILWFLYVSESAVFQSSAQTEEEYYHL